MSNPATQPAIDTTIDVQARAVQIWSEGSRLAADLYLPAGAGPHPAVLLCHGWGGEKGHLARYARKFAAAGFATLAFDYRGWGASDGRVVPVAGSPMLTEAGPATIEVQVIRQVVDPLDQIADVRAAFAYLRGQPGIDTARVALWGTSYGGGHVITVAANNPLVKAVVAQIGGFGPPDLPWWSELGARRSEDKACGRLESPIPQGIDNAPGLKGTPDVARMQHHDPRQHATDVRVPTLIIDAEFEELVDRQRHGIAVHRILERNVPTRYATFPCTHYGVYDAHFDAGSDLALEWFQTHL